MGNSEALHGFFGAQVLRSTEGDSGDEGSLR